jgi:hypothetical protein
MKPNFYEQTAGNAELHDLLANVNKKSFFFVSNILASFTSHESYFNTANFILLHFTVSKFFGYFTLSDLLH